MPISVYSLDFTIKTTPRVKRFSAPQYGKMYSTVYSRAKRLITLVFLLHIRSFPYICATSIIWCMDVVPGNALVLRFACLWHAFPKRKNPFSLSLSLLTSTFLHRVFLRLFPFRPELLPNSIANRPISPLQISCHSLIPTTL